jgi:hypothetical protein
MNVTFACPDCDTTSRLPLDADQPVDCPYCEWAGTQSRLTQDGQALDCCLVCGCQELFVRKNFSQRVGVTIVVIAAVASSVTWGFHMQYATFGILFGAALLDLALYLFVGNLLQCYRCHAEYRGLPALEDQEHFSLETHERYRQQAIRLAESEASQAKGGVT